MGLSVSYCRTPRRRAKPSSIWEISVAMLQFYFFWGFTLHSSQNVKRKPSTLRLTLHFVEDSPCGLPLLSRERDHAWQAEPQSEQTCGLRACVQRRRNRLVSDGVFWPIVKMENLGFHKFCQERVPYSRALSRFGEAYTRSRFPFLMGAGCH
jgi:hypothetical protein